MIVLAGTIGAGKTSLTKLLSQHLNSQPFFESVDDNPILPLFYKNPQKYGFLLQIYFLNRRLDEIKGSFDNDLNVLDRSIFEDSLLFKLNADLGRATQTESNIYTSLLNNMMEELPDEQHQKAPNLLIHIQVSFDTMLDRIKKRGRSFEQIDKDPSLFNYYKELNERYQKWYDQYDLSPKMVIDGDKYDFVEDDQAASDVLRQIDQKLESLNLK
ncbi:MAG: deoxynucleoside kinase [Limosilactobacillus coleohominis]|uniref:deoxynucleoside kinase n=1 Tax=Limosilactobacillus coleohominis TaxID=181675 RepID=UPI002A7F000B|nr:deoxynucleoside kinase [Limosilactobacillus coleohominis]MCI5812383.1 deoxynucleoside kinase [Lactobacillus sp.]MDY3703005.1 deoxynucleoside kinase [Limosilactobacillus coleohominis]MDY5629528.1 deoxynucleoside kinase [Limosilactobacillus coleohominis]